MKATATHIYHSDPCKRCGSKKMIVQMQDEVLTTYSGSGSILKITQIVCTNTECQRAFEKEIAEEEQKRAEAKVFKEQQDKIRKENVARNLANRVKTSRALQH